MAELILCDGYAVQADRGNVVPYNAAYFEKCAEKDDSGNAAAINAARIALVERHYGAGEVLDVGIGSGAFIKARPKTYGFDVNPVAVEWLRRNDLWSVSLGAFGALTFWDVLEHCPEPSTYVSRAQLYVFASIPVFPDLTRIRESKHYRPNEHLWYWTEHGFAEWMRSQGFLLLEANDDETRAGRESIMSFAFRRVEWRSR